DRFGSNNEHGFRHSLSLSCQYRHAERGEDVDVVPLSGNECFAAEMHWTKGAAAGKDRLAIRPSVGFFGAAFGTRGRIRIREDDRTLVDARHRFNHLLVE